MERPFPAVVLDFRFRPTSLSQRGVGGDSDESVQLGISCSMRLKHSWVSSTGEAFLPRTGSEAWLRLS